METAVRWLCSFYAEKVTIQRHTRTVTCGDDVLLYSITLTDPKSKFTNYHENKITVLYNERNVEPVGDSGCTFRIEEVNSRQLNVFCFACRIGRAKVNLDLGKWYQVEDQDLVINIVLPVPKKLRNVEVCCCEKPVDKQHRAESLIDTLYYAYYGIKSFVKFNVVDIFGNVIQPIGLYDVRIEYSYDNLEWDMRNGKMYAIFLPKQVGEQQMVLTLKRLNESAHTFQIPISVHHPPCSSSLTLSRLDDSVEQCCTAGKEFTFKVKLYDIFGKPVVEDFEETCDINVQTFSPKRAMTMEPVNIRKIITPGDVSFAVTVRFKIAGLRKLRLIVYSGSKSHLKDIDVEVLPSTPDHFNDMRFTTHGAVDESFSADPTVMYKNQWSIFEGEMVDRYDNVVRELGSEYDIHGLQLVDDEGEVMEIDYKDAEFRNERLQVQVKINDAGKHKLFITLTHRSGQNEEVVRMKEIPIQVIDAPLYQAGSKFIYPETCVAGKEFQLEVVLLDVFGCLVPVDSTTDCNLTGDILNSPTKLRMNKEITNFKITKRDSNEAKTTMTPGILSFAVTVCFKIAGHKQLRLNVNSSSKSYFKDIDVKVLPSTPHHFNYVKFTTHGAVDESFSGDPTVMYKNQWSIFEGEMVDRCDNVVRELGSEYNIHGLQLVNDEGEVMEMEYKDAEIRNERLQVQVKINDAGKHKLFITLTHRSGQNEEVVRTKEIPIQVIDAPLYQAGSKFIYPETCVAGKEFQVEVVPLDVFGCLVPVDSTTDCNLTGDILNSPLKLRMNEETTNFKITKRDSNEIKTAMTPGILSFAVTVCFKIAGHKQLRLNVNSSSKSYSKDIDVKVLPSTPDHFNDVRFTTHGAIDKSFSARPKVVYRNQWTMLEVDVVDRYGNLVRELGSEYNIHSLQLVNDEENVMKMKYKGVEFQNETLRVQLKINSTGKYNLAITLMIRNNHNELVHLKKIRIQVTDAPLYLARTKFRLHSENCVAGKEFELEVVPFDVFGCPLPADSTTDCNLTGDILNSPLKLSMNKETTNFKITKRDSNETKTAMKEHQKDYTRKINTPGTLSFVVTVCFTIAGHRKLRLIINSGSESYLKDICVKVLPSILDHFNDVRFTTYGAIDEGFCADPTVMYRNQWSILEAEMVDRYDNVRDLVGQYNIHYLQLVDDKGEVMEFEYKDLVFRNKRLRVQVKVNKIGTYSLVTTLVNRNCRNEVVSLKGIQIQVTDAPFYLAGSKFIHAKTCVAGKEFQLKVVPLDVFGCPVPSDSTADCNFTGDILNSLSKLSMNEETENFKMTKRVSKKTETAIKEHGKEQANIRKTNTCGNLSFAVTACFKIAGLRKLRLIGNSAFGSRSSFKDIYVKVLPSIPHHLNDVRFITHGAIDKSFSADPTVMYRNQWSILEADMVDRYDNVVCELDSGYNIGLQLINDEGKVIEMEYKDGEFRNKRLRVQVKVNKIGTYSLVTTLVNKNCQNEVVSLKGIQIQVTDAPLYLAGSKFLHSETCVAGKEFQLELVPLDVFGCPVPSDSTTDCNLAGDILNSLSKLSMNEETENFKMTKRVSNKTETAIEEHGKEQANIRKTNTCGNLSFTVTACVKIAGLRKLRLIGNSVFGSRSSFKDIYVKVLPSNPHHLNDVRFITHGAIDKSFSADPTVMYRNQWSVLEAEMVDRYDNVVCELDSRNNIGLQLVNDEGKVMEMEYKDGEFQNKRFRVEVKINKTGKYNLAITLVNRNNHDQEIPLKKIETEVTDAPLYLARSKYRLHPEHCVAGKEFQLEIVPFDVFGSPVPCDSTTDCNLTGDIPSLCLDLNESKETMDFRIIKNESNVVIRVSMVLTKAGRRKVKIIDKNNKSKELSIPINPEEKNVHWEIAAQPNETAYISEVRTDGSENTSQLIKRNGSEGLHAIKEFASLDYHHSTIEWIPEYVEIPDQPVFFEDETFQCCLRLKDILGNDYDGDSVTPDSITFRYGNTEVENIKVLSCPNDVCSYNIVVPLENLEKDDQSPKLWCFVNGTKIEKPLILPTFTRFEKHDDDTNCVVRREYKFIKIYCYGVKGSDIIGSDHAHLNNIKRVCELDEDPKVETCLDGPVTEAVVNLPFAEIANKEQKFRNILLHLLRATYYRNKAFKMDDAREIWKERASENYNKIKEGEDIDENLPHFCSQIKEKYAGLMRRYHDAACEEFFQFFNAERNQSEIDLHGLLVVDEEKLGDYARQLHSKGHMSSDEVQTKIEEERNHGNEAIRKLEERLDNYDMKKAKEEGEPWLEIIVGAGHHSKVRQRIRPKVKEFLEEERELEYSPVNKGALVVTFAKYSGREPCFGEYYCTKCEKSWKSGRSWVGMWQACYKCHKKNKKKQSNASDPPAKCYPLKQRPKRKQPYTPNIISGNPRVEHLQELCQKCVQLRRPCLQ